LGSNTDIVGGQICVSKFSRAYLLNEICSPTSTVWVRKFAQAHLLNEICAGKLARMILLTNICNSTGAFVPLAPPLIPNTRLCLPLTFIFDLLKFTISVPVWPLSFGYVADR